MDGLEDCLGELEELVGVMQAAGLCEVVFHSTRGSLVLRGAGRGDDVVEAGNGGGREGEEDGGEDAPARLVLLRSHCVGHWSRAREDGTEAVFDKNATLGTISTLLGEEGLKAPGPGRVEKWIIGEGEVAGFGDPIALFREVI